MNESAMLPMADILPLLSLQTGGSEGLLTGVLFGALLLVAALLWRYFRSPLVSLSRQLRSGRQSPREVAHQLAAQVQDNQPLSQQIDHLRFGASPPAAQAVAQLLRQVSRGD